MYLVTKYMKNMTEDPRGVYCFQSFWELEYEKTIITKSFSKSHAMTGYRIGWVVAEPSIIEKMSKLQALSLTNVSEPIQYVALQALEADISGNTEIIRSRLDALLKLRKISVSNSSSLMEQCTCLPRQNTRILTPQNFLKRC